LNLAKSVKIAKLIRKKRGGNCLRDKVEGQLKEEDFILLFWKAILFLKIVQVFIVKEI